MRACRVGFVSMAVFVGSLGVVAANEASATAPARWIELMKGERGEMLAARGVDGRGRTFIVTAFSSVEGVVRRSTMTYVQGRDVLQVEREADPASGVVLRWRTPGETLQAEIRPDIAAGMVNIALTLPDGSQRFLVATGSGQVLGEPGLPEELLSPGGRIFELARRFGRTGSQLTGVFGLEGGTFMLKATEPDCLNSCGKGCPQQCQDYCFIPNMACDICTVACYYGCSIGCTS